LDEVWSTAISIFEIRRGLSRMTAGRRRRALEAAFAETVEEVLGGRIVMLDRAAANAGGVIDPWKA